MAEILSRTDFLTDRRLPLKLIRRDPQEEYGLHSHEFSELHEIPRADGPARLLPRLFESGKKKREQNGNDSDNNQKLDQ